MDSKIIIDKINIIEKEFDVWKIKFGELQIWPLLRFDLFHYYASNINHSITPYKKPVNNLKKIKRFLSDIYWLLIRYYKEYSTDKSFFNYDEKNNYSKNSQADFLIYGISSHRSTEIDGKFFNRITDSIDLFLKKLGTSYHMESVFETSSHPKYSKTKIINKALIVSEFLEKIKNIFRQEEHYIEGYKEFVGYLQKQKIELNFDEVTLIERCVKLVAHSKYFLEAIKQIQPKLIFVDIYYHDRAMSLILAAKQLNIPTIELQHGLQGNHHYAYGRWLNFPKSGSQLFPDYFWVWNEQSYNNICDWSLNKKHAPILGGNTFLNVIKNKLLTFELPNEYSEKLKSFRSVILITLAYTSEEECTNLTHIARLIQNSEKDIYWIFRCHPANIESNKSALKSILKDLTSKNFSIQHPKEINLYALLMYIDTHITYASTVCMEAATFGIPNIIFGKAGYNHFKSYIEDGTFEYADTYEKINYLINNKKISKSNRIKPIIKTDTSLIFAQLNYLLSIKNKLQDE